MTTRVTPAADWDPLDPAAVEDPFATHAHLRDVCPVARSERWGGFWSLMRHEDVIAASLDTETFISGEKTTIPDSTGPHRPPRPPLEVDRPEHTHYRRLLAPYFSAEQARQLEPRIREIAAELIHTAIAERECDLVPTVAVPMPALVLCAVLGLPSEDWSFLKRSTAEVIEAGARRRPRASCPSQRRDLFVRPLGRRSSTGSAARPRHRHHHRTAWSSSSTAANWTMTRSPAWFASSSRPATTRPRTAWAARSGTWPRRRRSRLACARTRREIPAAVDEILRAFSPAQMLARTVTREVEIGRANTSPRGQGRAVLGVGEPRSRGLRRSGAGQLDRAFRIVMSRSGMASTGAWALPWRGPRCAWPSRRFLPARGDSTWSGRHPRSGGRTSAPGRCRSDFSENVGFR